MKKFIILTIAATSSLVFAQTDFTNADGANNFIDTAGNWDSGLPIGQQGTIDINAGYQAVTYTGYDILQTGGTLSRSSGLSALSLDNSDWEMNGATAAFASNIRGMTLSNGSTFTLNNGTYDQENNRDITLNSSSSITVNGGAFNAGRSIRINGGTSFTMNGGTADTTGTFGQGGFITGSGAAMNLNGGTLTADRFVFQQASTTATFGGTTAGSASFNNWGTGNGAGNSGDRQDDTRIQIDFLSGSLMSMTMESTARELDFDDDTVGDAGTEWAEALWNNDQLFFGGQSSTDLGGLSWADATNSSIGLGGGEYFVFTSAGTYGGTLSLAVIPEPSSIALMGVAGLAMFAFARKRRA